MADCWRRYNILSDEGIGYVSILPGRDYIPASKSKEGLKATMTLQMSCCVHISCKACVDDPTKEGCSAGKCCCMGDAFDVSAKATCNDAYITNTFHKVCSYHPSCLHLPSFRAGSAIISLPS